MMIMKLHDFLVVKTNDGEVVMKVREHCFAGVWKNSPLKVVNMMLPAPPSPPIGRHIVTVFLQRKRANMVTMYDRFISPNCRPEYLPPLNCHTIDPCPPTTVTPTALSSSSGRPRKQSKCSVQECDGTGHRNPARWSEGHTTRAGCSLACQTFILPKGKKSLGICLFRFGSRNLELFCVT